jgi:hypothetical protein
VGTSTAKILGNGDHVGDGLSRERDVASLNFADALSDRGQFCHYGIYLFGRRELFPVVELPVGRASASSRLHRLRVEHRLNIGEADGYAATDL